jgi:hypothetical protein
MILNQFEELARQADLEWPIVCPLQYRLVTIADEFAMLHGEPINLPLWEAGLRFEGVDDFKQERRKAHAKFMRTSASCSSMVTPRRGSRRGMRIGSCSSARYVVPQFTKTSGLRRCTT